MNANRANPIHYNLRSNQAAENNANINIANNNQNSAENNENAVENIDENNIVINNMAEAQTKIIPSRFTGSLKDNAAFWIQKSEKLYHQFLLLLLCKRKVMMRMISGHSLLKM